MRVKGNVGVAASLLLCVAGLLHPAPVDGGKEEEILKALDEAAAEGSWGYVPLSGPYIDIKHSGNITARLGSTAILNCRILYMVGKPVSWMRSRDLHLLTVGRFTYTSDERFKAVHQAGSQDWLLKIFYVQLRDAGQYECQVGTTPPMTHSVWLSIMEPQTVVLGGPDLYINAGSAINLTCLVKHSPKPTPYIFWYHDDVMLNPDSGPDVSVTVSSENDHDTVSRLIIRSAAPRNSGQYKCMPATAPPHSITVHVINSDKPAAIHHKNTTSNSSSGSGPAHLPPVPLQVFLVGLLPLAVAGGGGDLGRIISRTVGWWRAWGCTWLAASCWRWWDGHAASTFPRSTRVR
ncbi:hemicentin-1-like [Eriocheir sinensis]|uniref:hemicentin-1-like n=1 Tax=Eriocheir sinensis TaxID=95602 RepID=UPI0021C6137D|nr:hemicentin-1-like [Eriocheir sinensis]